MQIVIFPSLQEIGSVIFFKNCCAFAFSDAKSYGFPVAGFLVAGVTGLIF